MLLSAIDAARDRELKSDDPRTDLLWLSSHVLVLAASMGGIDGMDLHLRHSTLVLVDRYATQYGKPVICRLMRELLRPKREPVNRLRHVRYE